MRRSMSSNVLIHPGFPRVVGLFQNLKKNLPTMLVLSMLLQSATALWLCMLRF